jgi:protein transport protein SEC24
MNKAATTKISSGTDHIADSMIQICKAYGKEVMAAANSGAAHLSICENLKLLPLLALALLKSVRRLVVMCSELYNDQGC